MCCALVSSWVPLLGVHSYEATGLIPRISRVLLFPGDAADPGAHGLWGQVFQLLFPPNDLPVVYG